MKRGTNWLEWIVVAASAVLVLGSAAVLGWELATAQPGLPVIAVAAGAPLPLGGGWAVPVTATNRSDETAENVVIEVELGDGEDAPRAELQIPYLPKGSERSGWVTFADAPGAGREPRARVVGYGKP